MDSHLVRTIVTAALTVVAMLLVARQCRKPMRWAGKPYLWLMNVTHAELTDWGLQHVVIEKPFTILDVGCGGGKTVAKLAALASEGKVYGIDYSSESVATSSRTNAALIAAGRVDIRQGDVSHLPYPDDTFDVVTAVETHYYWPNPVEDLREIRRVLKPGGRLVLIAEAYKSEGYAVVTGLVMKLLRAKYLSVSEHRELLSAAGYAEVTMFEERGKGWLCGVARK